MKPSKKKKAPPRTEKKQAKPRAPGERPGDRIVEASFCAGATQLDQFPPPAFSEIAFAGRSNVGKSSLMNCLTSRKNLVRTSGTPGCTRQVAWFRTTSDDKAMVDLVDLPGYGYARRSKVERRHWGDLIEGYLMERPTLKGVVILVDIRRGPEEEELELIKMLREPARVSRAPLELTLVATKLDKISNSAHKPSLAAIKQKVDLPVFGFSATSGEGKTPLWRRLRRIAGVAFPEATKAESAASQHALDHDPAEHATHQGSPKNPSDSSSESTDSSAVPPSAHETEPARHVQREMNPPGAVNPRGREPKGP